MDYVVSTETVNYDMTTPIMGYVVSTEIEDYGVSTTITNYGVSTEREDYSVSTTITNYGVSTEMEDYGMSTEQSQWETIRPGSESLGDFVPWDNPDNIITQETEFWIGVGIAVGAIPLLWAVGVAGNVLSALSFWRQGLGNRVNVCVLWLAAADLLSLTVTFLLYAEGAWRRLVGPSHVVLTYITGLTGFWAVSQFLSAVIAAERCFCVVRPLTAQRRLTPRKMAVFLAAVSVSLMGGFVAVAGHKYQIARVRNPATNTTKHVVQATSFYRQNRATLDICDVFVFHTALPFLFALVILVATAITAKTLATATRLRLKMAPYRASSSATASPPREGAARRGKKKTKPVVALRLKEASLTRMLLATSLLFLLFVTPTLLVSVASFTLPELRLGGRYHNLIMALWSLVALCRALNSSLNFFIYYAMGSKFRASIKDMLSCRRRSSRSRSTYSSTTP